MLSFSSKQRYFLYRGVTDMRKGFNGLSGLVREHIEHDLMSGDVFIFMNRRRDRVKLLMWDATGFAVWYKVLESGTFELPDNGEETSLELNWSRLVMLLEGVELKVLKGGKDMTEEPDLMPINLYFVGKHPSNPILYTFISPLTFADNKSKVMGRTPKQILQLLDQQDHSGLSVAKFCAYSEVTDPPIPHI